ncbi:hypothetical protein [Arthrobacter sp. NyZ413]|nr:hypothetical protein [Arthrobacter sp.]
MTYATPDQFRVAKHIEPGRRNHPAQRRVGDRQPSLAVLLEETL